MPYITKDRQRAICMDGSPVDNAGELNFCLTAIIKDYVERKGLSYQSINDVKGALQGALAEFDRRVVAPYEDQKIQDNGDVY